jgi:carboxyl-terminal processing protease
MRAVSSFARARVFTCTLALVTISACLPVVAVRPTHAQQLAQNAQPQQRKLSGVDRDRGLEMLEKIEEDLSDNYYDPKFHGMDVDARFKIAKERIKNAVSNGEIFSVIAQVLVELDDSHTYFLPPNRVLRVDYGWRMQVIGDKCYVTAVKPGSDAQSKGLKVGDEIYSIDGYEPSRSNLWKMEYSYYLLKPRPGMRVVVQDPDGQQRELILAAKVLANRDIPFLPKRDPTHEPRYYEMGDDLIICKLPTFEIGEKDVDEMMTHIGQHKALVLDLRGNGGGSEAALLRLLGYFFDHDIKIGELQQRKKTRSLNAKTRGDKVFKGRLVVLVDSKSGSASELFTRVIQLEQRGPVLGDRTAGAVMRGRFFSHAFEHGPDEWISFSLYGAVITVANLVMTDGKSLEKVGIVPDELLLPTRADLFAQRDPVLARAAALVGVQLDAKKAGTLFPPDQETEVNTDTEQGDGGKDKN